MNLHRVQLTGIVEGSAQRVARGRTILVPGGHLGRRFEEARRTLGRDHNADAPGLDPGSLSDMQFDATYDLIGSSPGENRGRLQPRMPSSMPWSSSGDSSACW